MDDEIRRLGGEGILTPEDIDDFGKAELRVALFMADGHWHHGQEICKVAGNDGIPATEGLRRFRAARAKLQPLGWRFERERLGAARNFWYRMLPPLPEKETLF